VAVDAQGLITAPEGDAVQVALLSLGPATALLMIQDFVQLAPEDWVIQNAANSAVGRILIQLAKDLKIRLVNTVKSSPVIGELKEIGAGAVLLDTDDLRERVLAVTQGAPLKLALDAVGGAATARLARCLADEAVIVSYGALSGEPCQVPSEALASRGMRLCGMNASRQLARKTPEERRALYDRIGEMLAAKRLQARIAGTYELHQSIEAIRRAMVSGDKRFGKVAIHIKDLPARSGAASGETAAPQGAGEQPASAAIPSSPEPVATVAAAPPSEPGAAAAVSA